MRSALVSAVLTALLLAGCASNGPERPTASRDAVLQAPERHVPDGVADIRSELASQRASTLSQMDVKSGSATSPDGAGDGTPWWGPVFDVLEFGATFGHLLW